ncbi:hypothetical protein [uncultured Sphingomonas sp.]|uniref:hypothetical protein n=1 Tax=uncultured Sphingomonas sp. TaxID=158754 RepID=UPI0035CA6674
MTIPALLLLAQAPDAAAMMAAARDAVARPRCVYDAAATDVTVCGLRHADRYRVPFLTHDAGDPRYEAVAAERDRLLHRTTPLQDLSPFLVGGGMVGVRMTAGGAAGTRVAGLRPLAP